MTQSMEKELSHEFIGSFNDAMPKIDRLFDAARPEAVFAEPVTAEGRTIISAAEVLVGAGFGGGGGYDSSPDPTVDPALPAPTTDGGVGGGGGGFAQSRPVAVIVIDRDGVRVEPIVDVTKLGLAALTVFGSFLFLVGRMLHASRR